MTYYDQRATIVCPAVLLAKGNALAAVAVTDASAGPGNLETFKQAHWQDGDGNLYAVSSATVGENFFLVKEEQLVRPAWDEDMQVNMTGAERAQEAIRIFPNDAAAASPDTLLVIIGDDYMAQLAQAGLSRVPVDI